MGYLKRMRLNTIFNKDSLLKIFQIFKTIYREEIYLL